jgi:S-adenosylmethionine hydrolase
VLFTDFGVGDIYVGQVKAVLQRLASGAAVIDLLHDVPAFNARAGAHLLASMNGYFAEGSVFLAVVDPGVGSARDAVVVRADGRWYVGPDNGLLSVVAARSRLVEYRRVVWRPQHLSESFHGRDLFAPIAAALAAQGCLPQGWSQHVDRLEVELGGGDLHQIIYVDHYGNAHTGVRADSVAREASLLVGSYRLPYARVFSATAEGDAFWYKNSQGLAEIAVNCGNAAQSLGLKIGNDLRWT